MDFIFTCMFGFCELMSALARSGKFLRSKMKGFVSSSGSGCGRTPTDLCWWWDHLLWWLRGSDRRLWTWFCCSKASGTYWTPPPWIRCPWTCKHKAGDEEFIRSGNNNPLAWSKGKWLTGNALRPGSVENCVQMLLSIMSRQGDIQKPVSTIGLIITSNEGFKNNQCSVSRKESWNYLSTL